MFVVWEAAVGSEAGATVATAATGDRRLCERVSHIVRHTELPRGFRFATTQKIALIAQVELVAH
jgi:hypothetical protein